MSIYNKNKSHILFGKRSSKSGYRPLYYALPGGISEKKDIKKPIGAFCRRELNEEINLDFTESQFELVGIIQNLELVGIQLIFDVYSNIEIPKFEILTNEEWEDGSLKWYPISSLQELPINIMLHELHFKILRLN